MKTGSRLQTFARLKQRTPLRSTPPKAFTQRGVADGAEIAGPAPSAPLEAQRFAKPRRKQKAAPKPMPRKRMKARRPRRIDRETPEEAFYKSAIHRLPCVGITRCPDHVCSGDIEQSHERSIAKGSGTGIKLKNTECCAMCWGLARAWDDNVREFEGWPKAKRLAWMAERVAETKEVLGPLWAEMQRRAA